MRIWFVIAMLASFLMGCETTPSGPSVQERFDALKADFMTRAEQLREDLDGGPGEVTWAIMSFTPTGRARSRQGATLFVWRPLPASDRQPGDGNAT